ncbi:hypothetical protein [Pseudomonas sp. GV071]|uniref:hypothetical protein n=1 Tax=Pseudomonas sp. GV071 TaxID=2135754 RepID=UPI000D4121FF|nr:hypothetical protein [Pseudomonas sp. GV071]PTQ70620.1 hypothetical protein C8K61_106347 [Pseudomonas sp. GV071]
MENTPALTPLLTAVAAVAGVVAKSLWDLYWKRWETLADASRKTRLEFLERQLSSFYWPIYLYLQKNNVVWDQLVNGKAFDDSIRRQVNSQLHLTFFRQNHDTLVKLIESNIHIAQPDAEFESILLEFVRHVTLYSALRDLGHENIDPIAFNVPWPNKFFAAVEQRLASTQKEYEGLLGWTSGKK